MTTFSAFKQCSATDIFSRLGTDISGCISWDHYRSFIRETNSASGATDPENCLTIRAIQYSGILSLSERLVLKAALTAADFAHMADEIEGNLWEDMPCLDQKNRAAIAAVIIRENS